MVVNGNKKGQKTQAQVRVAGSGCLHQHTQHRRPHLPAPCLVGCHPPPPPAALVAPLPPACLPARLWGVAHAPAGRPLRLHRVREGGQPRPVPRARTRAAAACAVHGSGQGLPQPSHDAGLVSDRARYPFCPMLGGGLTRHGGCQRMKPRPPGRQHALPERWAGGAWLRHGWVRGGKRALQPVQGGTQLSQQSYMQVDANALGRCINLSARCRTLRLSPPASRQKRRLLRQLLLRRRPCRLVVGGAGAATPSSRSQSTGMRSRPRRSSA